LGGSPSEKGECKVAINVTFGRIPDQPIWISGDQRNYGSNRWYYVLVEGLRAVYVFKENPSHIIKELSKSCSDKEQWEKALEKETKISVPKDQIYLG
jgi:hypothetical protein